MDGAERLADIGVFTTAATFAQLGDNAIGLDVALTVPAETYRSTDPGAMAQRVADGSLRLTGDGVTVTSSLATVADRFREEQRLVVVGVVIGVGELLVVTWLALFLAIRRTADARRGDIELLKLRGTRRRDLWRLVAALILFPLIVGGAIGVAAGPWLSGILSGRDTGPDWTLAVGAAGIAIFGAAVAAFAAERRSLVASPGRLTRRAVAGAGRWTLLVDSAVVLLAAAGVYEATAGGAAAVGGIGLIAPLLAALAVGVLATRLVAVVASRVGTRTLRSGRLGPALAALQLARRPGMSSALGVAVVVVATLVTTALAWSTANSAYEQRAVAEIGAPTVLTVRASSPGQLLSAVRRADPAGRSAMAVVRTEAAAGPVLAVDTTRLAAVAPYLDGYGTGDWDAVAKTLHPAGFTPALLKVAQVELDASWLPVGGPAGVASLSARLAGADGTTDVAFGPVAPGRHIYRAPTPSCTAGCRLVSVTLSSTVGRPAAGSGLTLHSVSGLAPGMLADRGRWRASVSAGAQVPQLTAGAAGLSIVLGRGVPADADNLSVSAYVADAPTPLPVLRAGNTALSSSEPRSAVLGNDVLPVRLAGQGRSLPEIRTGLLADLEYADRLASRPQEPTMQVWLAASAPAGIEADLTAAGLTVLSRASIGERRSALESHGSAAALRFMLAVAVVALGLVLLSFAIAAAAELRPWAADLGALRRQGLAGRLVRRAATLGYLAAAAVAVGLGLLTGLALRLTLPAAVPIFADGWSDVDIPGASPVLAAGLATTVAVLFGAVAVAAAGVLVARTGHQIEEVPWSD
jgi:hypothetical protein